jgi:hypothetical protein
MTGQTHSGQGLLRRPSRRQRLAQGHNQIGTAVVSLLENLPERLSELFLLRFPDGTMASGRYLQVSPPRIARETSKPFMPGIIGPTPPCRDLVGISPPSMGRKCRVRAGTIWQSAVRQINSFVGNAKFQPFMTIVEDPAGPHRHAVALDKFGRLVREI